MNVPVTDEFLTDLETVLAAVRQLTEKEAAYYVALELVERVDARIERGVHVVYQGQRYYRLDDVVRAMGDIVNLSMGDIVNLSKSQLLNLCLIRSGCTNQQMICQARGKPKSTIKGQLDRLRELGLVNWRKNTTGLQLTEDGKAIIRHMALIRGNGAVEVGRVSVIV